MNNIRFGAGILALALWSSVPSVLSAQETGRVIGRVLDAATAAPLSSAQVFIAGGTVGALTDLNGRYVLSGVPQGTVDITVQLIGYGTKTVTGIQVGSDVVTLDITLEEAAVELEGITISAERERGSQAFLLDSRRTSTSLVEAVGAADISRRPDSDAADVAQRLTGVTVAEGKYVFVRGLGERYSQTSLNGSSLPSPEPEREVVPLDLFPSGFLESLETQKSYTPDLPADFSGGSVKIKTKDFPNEFVVRFGMGTSFNTQSQFQDDFLRYAGGGRDYLGFDDGTRDQPAALVNAMGDVRSGQRLPADPNTVVEIGRALQGLGGIFTPGTESTPYNRSFNLSVGGRNEIGDESELGYFVAGNYSDSYSIRADEIERKWRTTAFDPTVDPNLRTPNVDYLFNRGTRNISWGTIANVTFKPSPSQQISLRTTINTSADDEARVYEGANQEDIGGNIRAERSRFISRLMTWGQLAGEHQLFGESKLEWRATAARANRDEPLLREAIYLQDDNDFLLLDTGESGRYFWSDLTDDDLSGEVDWAFPFEMGGNGGQIKVGSAYRNRTRDFGARRLNWDFSGGTYTDIDAALASAEVVPTVRREGQFALRDIVEPGDVYDADDRRVAGYLMIDVPVTESLQAIFGARVENYQLDLNARGETLTSRDQTDVVGSVNLIYTAREDVKVRAAASRTLDRPEFRELAPFQFTEATSLRQLFGNPDLESADIVSGDLRVDWFPAPGEIFSIGGFMKSMTDPIEQVFIAAASTAYSFQNAKDATVYGLEIDSRVGLNRIAESLSDMSLQANYSWITSEVNVREDVSGFDPTNLVRPLEGQATYVLNLGVNYADLNDLEAGVFFNRFGERLTAAAGAGVPDIYEQPRNSLDASIGFPLMGGAKAKVRATNLLDAAYLFSQEDNGINLVQREYRTGRTFSVGLSWEF